MMRRGPGSVMLGLLLLATTGLQSARAAEAVAAQKLADVAQAAGFTGELGATDGTSTSFLAFADDGKGSRKVKPTGDRWRWASVTKQVVAVLMLQEVAKGTVDLDAPVSRYLPTFASANAAKITVRQLLRHQTGLPNPDDTATGSDAMPPYYLAGYTGSRDPLTGYCAGPVKGEAGQGWSYNNCDYIVAGALLEAVTGKAWPKLVAERIARPLGLKSLRVARPGLKSRAGFVGGKAEPAIDLASFAASAALTGTVADLLAFDRALMGGKLLGTKELAALWDGQPKLGFIALGQWSFSAPLAGCTGPQRIVERRGGIGGVAVRNFILPERGVALALFSDRSDDDFAFGEIWQGAGFGYTALSAAACGGVSKKP